MPKKKVVKKIKKVEVVKARGSYTAEAPTIGDVYQAITATHKRTEYLALGKPTYRKVRITPKTPRLRR